MLGIPRKDIKAYFKLKQIKSHQARKFTCYALQYIWLKCPLCIVNFQKKAFFLRVIKYSLEKLKAQKYLLKKKRALLPGGPVNHDAFVGRKQERMLPNFF